jgi:glycosyltransferase involved in cell wall biosynthesis
MKFDSLAIVLCHYEQHDTLVQAIRSIGCQTRAPDQIIVVDDGSRQQPQESELQNECYAPVNLITLSENSGGPAKPRNQAIASCRCSHLMFLDADDILMPHTLKILASIWESNPSAVAYGDQICWGSGVDQPFLQRAIAATAHEGHPNGWFYQELLMGTRRVFLSGSGGPTKLFQSYPFDPEQRWEDYDLWLRLAQGHCKFEHTGHMHTLYRVQAGSRSGSRAARHAGCIGIKQKHLRNIPTWRWPMWYWKQRYL